MSLTSEIVDRVRAEAPDCVCVSALTPRSAAHARLLCKRLEEGNLDGIEVIVGLWAAPIHELGPRVPAPAIERSTRIATATELMQTLQSLCVRRGGDAEPMRSHG